MKITWIILIKTVCICVSILEIPKIVTYEFFYDFVKPHYGEKVKLCYMNTDRSIVSIKTKDIYLKICYIRSKDEKLVHRINRNAAKISAKLLSSDQSQFVEQPSLTCSNLGRALEKQTE